MSDKANDSQYEETTIREVRKHDDGSYSIGRDDGWSFFLESCPIDPKPGMRVRQYGRGIGYSFRGVDIDGVEVFYMTEWQHEQKMKAEAEAAAVAKRQEFELKRAEYDRQYNALPDAFKARIDRFRANNPDFRWKYESYELFCCEQAIAIAAKVDARDIEKFRGLDWDRQKVIVPDLSDGHSGNTFGCACALAYWYRTQPENVAILNGSLSPLVGSEAFGDVPAGARQA